MALCRVERYSGAKPVLCTVVSTRGSGRGLRYVVVVATEAEERHIVLPMSRVLKTTQPKSPPAVAGEGPHRAYESGTAALCHVERDPAARPVPCTVVSTRGSGRGLRYVVVVATEAEEQHIVLPKSRVMEASGRGRRRGARLRRVSRGQSRPGLRVDLPRHRHGRQGGQRGQSHLLPHQRHLGRRHAGSGLALRPALPYLREQDRSALQRHVAAADEDGAVHGGLARGQRPSHDLQGRH